jgi:hypothetical protein
MGRAEKNFIETDPHWSLPTRSCLYWVYCRLYITGKESDTGSHSHMIASDLCIDSPYNINGRLFWKSCTFERVVRIHWSGEIRSYFCTSKIPTVYNFWSLKTTMVTTKLDDKLIQQGRLFTDATSFNY